ncbi:hypothetical protein J056_000650 [Wallemia ichthyophaga EXF-994]|uniref:Hexosyltransferase n=1 Tax=Wallemia ichthyophaga (strain EXF-994 / CBS 113033) TaxID=1299270 RepID=R9AE47_WALI9|nr:uncharacterized protein J056_000650 [Wallemia ichthyophaga EXF-994]EOR00452.1 hypothetical protein J056_000650 [Wallemia ichthyophaga EXF-994]TIA69637.1 hypothetical protein E3P91_03500 [Wallemia ichthyophaga]TIB29837.1 hypothetical protein E3P84_03586 [Wallemia ichthyophaga]TIB39387.1 hypothetical protein E3P83_03512 [Wallemia ichthyophaga]
MNRNARRKARSLDSNFDYDDNDFKLRRSWLDRLSSQRYFPKSRHNVAYALIALFLFAFSLTKFLMWYLNPDKEPLPWRSYCQESSPFPHQLADSLPPVTILVGVMSIDRYAERRNVIRQTYARNASPRDSRHIQVVFVITNPRSSLRHAVYLEQETFGDLVILDVKENMNSGKSYEFFNWASKYAWLPDPATLPTHLISFPSAYNNPHENMLNDLHRINDKDLEKELFGFDRTVKDPFITNDDAAAQHAAVDLTVTHPNAPQNSNLEYKRPDFIVKADDDSFIILGELERHLRILPKSLIYWGYLVKNKFMGGQAYALSFDIVKWMANSEFVRNHRNGREDKVTANWVRHHPQAHDIQWVSESCWIYNHPKTHTVYSHGFLFPSEVTKIRQESIPGTIGEEEQIRRGQGNKNHSEAYSTVFKWGQKYAEPLNHLSAVDRVAALVEGADESLSKDEKKFGILGSPRQTLSERYEGRPWGGTVIVHFIKRHEWFYETALAFLTDWSLIPKTTPIASKNYWTKTIALNKDDDFDRQRGWRLVDSTDVKSVDIYRFKTTVDPFPTS